MTVGKAKYQALVIEMMKANGVDLHGLVEFLFEADGYYEELCDLLYNSLTETISVSLNEKGKPGTEETDIIIWDSSRNNSNGFTEKTDVIEIVHVALTNFSDILNILQKS